jgi:hypothetical protein
VTVLVWGVPSEAPVALTLAALADLGADTLVISPRPGEDVAVDVELSAEPAGAGLSGTVRASGRRVALAGVTGAYLRPVEPELVPGLSELPPDAPAVVRARRVYGVLAGLTETAPLTAGWRVANPLSAMASNLSKPFQAQAVLRHGFATPETLISDDVAEVRDFAARHGEVVYKSISGVRSVVTAFSPRTDLDRLDRLRWCPVQFQERVGGPDVRVHVVGEETFAVIVHTDAVDYRYARAQVGVDARVTSYRLGDDIAERCVTLAADLGLPFAGIDLKLAPDGRVVCFEVNPSPGYSFFEQVTGVPISGALARWLLAAGS